MRFVDHLLSKALPLADVQDYPVGLAERLAPDQAAEWMVMEIHDLVTHHDHPQTAAEGRSWFDSVGCKSVSRADSGNRHGRPAQRIDVRAKRAA